ncbi:MAG: bifunctional diguanylate cyclase/phosphodiesterase [Pseudomonadota bacterium]
MTTQPRRGLAWLFLAASLLGFGLSAFIASTSRDIMQASTPLVREKIPLLEDIGQVERSLLATQNNNYQYFAYAINRPTFLNTGQQLQADFERSLTRLERAFPGDARLVTIREAFQNSSKLLPQLDRLMEPSPQEKGDLDEVRAVLVEMTIDTTEIRNILSELRHLIQQAVYQAGAETESKVAQMTTLIVAYSVLIFFIALLVVYHIQARARAESQLAYNAVHDFVTGLYNRRALETRLKGLDDRSWILITIAVERFHRLAGTLGHEIADAALRAFAERLQRQAGMLKPEMYRLDGAKFGLLYYVEENQATNQALMDIFNAATQPIHVGQYELLISIACGSARFPSDGQDAVTLMRNANTALQQAQRSGQGYVAYVPAFNARSAERLEMEAALGHAVERDELVLLYQPQMAIATGRLVGFEALVRWRQGEWMISPVDFIPIAEETGLIVPLGEWILRQACRQAADWQAAGSGPLVVAVNISARQFQDPGFLEMVTRTFREVGVAPALIELEITESAIMQDPDRVIDELQQLQQLGISLAIDDFGTGYSSLAYLKRFPIDKLKVDQSFVRQLGESCASKDSAIVEAVVRLGQTLNLRVIAEGVETEAQLKLLGEMGCDEIQGYLLSKPLALADATAFWLARRLLP